jgi:hypothetical protein
MGREGIPIDDQHALMLKRPEMHDGDVHFTTQGSAIQAAQVTAKIREVLGKSSKPWMLILTHNGGPRIVGPCISAFFTANFPPNPQHCFSPAISTRLIPRTARATAAAAIPRPGFRNSWQLA